jgi:hypothetical protein
VIEIELAGDLCQVQRSALSIAERGKYGANSKTGYLPAQRQTAVAWQGFTWLPDVVLIQPDPEATEIVVQSAEPQVAAGSVVNDAAGTRQAVLLVPANTIADLALPDGTTEPLTTSTLTVHLTEYTVGPSGPQAMPAELPADERLHLRRGAERGGALARGCAGTFPDADPAVR